jgi:transcriptional regulator with XRE-family HTH domain
MARSGKTFDELVGEEQSADPSFRAEWQRFAPAREFATALIRYRAERRMNQRELAKRLGVSQPRIVKLESGEHNPELETIINAVRRLGLEFCLDVAPAGKKRGLLTAHAQRNARERGTEIDHDDVSVLVAASCA